MQDVKLYTQNAPQYEGDCEYRISSFTIIRARQLEMMNAEMNEMMNTTVDI